MSNRNLCNLLPWIPKYWDRSFKEMILDSREVSVNDLFIAVNGNNTDGRLFINQAIMQGATAVLAQSDNFNKDGKIYSILNMPICCINSLNMCLSKLASHFYKNPSYKMCLIGVTGTNGKTTITHLLGQWIKNLGKSSAIMGTIGNGITGHTLYQTNNTTDSTVKIQQMLALLYKKKVRFVAMEVSSHGLQQNRVNGLRFKAAIFTNLSRDHLDYHGNMKQYESAKWRLFTELDVDHYIINADDNTGWRWLHYLPKAVAVSIKRFSLLQLKNDYLYANDISYYKNGTNICFSSSWGNGKIYCRLLGEFNISNLLLSLATLLSLGYPLQNLLKTANNFKPICGRMEIFNIKNRPTVLVDYAHTPEALKKALIAIKQHYQSKLWCIFGCGGMRDKGKRSLMGAIAEKYADHIIITNDNPRCENEFNIINDIISGVSHAKFQVIPNRKQAIYYAIIHAQSTDTILIAGKGHENYQIIGHKQFNFSDQDIVTKFMEKYNDNF